MLPKYYRFCLWVTVIECVVAFPVALTPWVNLLPAWITMPNAKDPNLFEKYMTCGYGFWAGMWAIPNYIMLRCKDMDTVRLWAKFVGLLYLLWWIMWWVQLWTFVWQWYAMVFYVPWRAYQMGANLWFGFKGPGTKLAEE